MKTFFTALLLALFCSPLLLAQGPEPKPRERKHFPSFVTLPEKANVNATNALLRQFLEMTPDDELRSVGTTTDQLGFSHQKFQQYYKGVPVDGATYTVHASRGQISHLSGNYRDVSDVNTTASQSAAAAFNRALSHVGARRYVWDDGAAKPTGDLVIFTDAQDRGEPRLAYKFDIHATDPLSRAYVYIDAQSGGFLGENARIHETNTPATAVTRYNGSRSITADFTGSNYRLRQTADGNGIETYSLNNGTNYNSATDITSSTTTFTSDQTANQAHWGAEQTHKYYLQTHSRNSYNNAGAIIKSYVHYSTNYVNAFWDGTRMTYGDGNGTTYGPLVSLDICGHEITHGVTEYSANLVYQKESGALNESFSDIFGEAVENFATGANDWQMGTDIGIGGSGAIRSMNNPNAYGDPDTYGGTNWINPNCTPSQANDYCGVHTNSGVQNKWFYILSVGESGTNDIGSAYSVTGIGIAKAAAIAYRNLTVYLTSTSTYNDARTGAIQSAVDLYGAGSPEEIATTNAWYAVGVGGAYGTISYCTSSGANSSYEWISRVTIGSFSNPSGAAGYTNFTNLTVNLTAGQGHSVSLVPGFASTTYNEYWRIWIDYNADGDFTDAGELVFSGGPSNTTVNGTLNVAAGASGTTRMRVSMKWNAAQTGPCETFSYGEVEDYAVAISGGGPDTQAPTAPGNLAASGTTQTSTNLSWTASTDNVGVTGYDVYVDGVLNGSTAGLTYTVNGLTAATTYAMSVRAKDAAGNQSTPSAINVTTLTAGDTQAPTAPGSLAASNTTQTSTDLSWTASTDNVGVTGYDVYVDGVLNGSTAGLTYTVNGLTAATTYTMSVRAKDAAGNQSAASTINVTTQSGGGGSDVLLGSYFESGWDGWADGGSDCARYGGSRSWEGTYSIQIRDNSGVASAMTSPTFNLNGYTQVDIEFYFYAYSMENGEDFWVRYYNGSTWSTVAAYARGTSFNNNTFYVATVTLTSAQVNFASNAQIRFQCDASANNDQIYIDAVTVTASNPSTFLPPSTPSIQEVAGGGRLQAPATVLTTTVNEAAERVVLYPNPVNDQLNVRVAAPVRSMTILSVNGAVLRQFAVVDEEQTIDVSGLEAGVYFLSIQTDKEVINRKFVKQ